MSVDGWNFNLNIAIPLSESPYIHLTSAITTRSFNEILDLINVDKPQPANNRSDSKQFQVDVKPIREGTTISVYGNVRFEEGEPVIHGTDTVPLIISDREFDNLRQDLRTTMLKSGLVSVILITMLVSFWLVILG